MTEEIDIATTDDVAQKADQTEVNNLSTDLDGKADDNHAHPEYTTETEAADAAPVQSVNGETGNVQIDADVPNETQDSSQHTWATLADNADESLSIGTHFEFGFAVLVDAVEVVLDSGSSSSSYTVEPRLTVEDDYGATTSYNSENRSVSGSTTYEFDEPRVINSFYFDRDNNSNRLMDLRVRVVNNAPHSHSI